MNFNYFWNRPSSLLGLLILALTIFQVRPAGGRIYIDINSPLQEKILIAVPAFRFEGGEVTGLPLS